MNYFMINRYEYLNFCDINKGNECRIMVRFTFINVNEYRWGHQKWAIQRNWQQDEKTKKTQHTMCWTQLHANTHKQRKYTGAIIQTTVISVREID